MNTTTAGPAGPSWRRDAEIIGLVGLAHGTSHFFHLLLPPLFPWLIERFTLSYTRVGALMAVFFAVSGVGQALAGFVVDRLGPRVVLLSGIATLAAGACVLGAATGYPMLLLAAAITGAGNSIFHPTDFSLLNRRVSVSRLGHAFSMHGLTGNLGWTAGATLMGSLALTVGWRAAAFAAASVAAAVWAVLFARREALDAGHVAAPAPHAGSRKATAAPLGFLQVPAVWMCFLFFFLGTGAFSVLQNFAPAVLGNVYGISAAAAAGGLSAYLAGSTAGYVAGGFIAARTRRSEAAIAVTLGAAALMSAWLALGTVPVWLLGVLLAVMGFGVGCAGPSRDLLVRRTATGRLGAGAYGRVYGFVYSGLDAGMAVTPLVFGRLLDAGLFRAALAAVALMQLAALLTALRIGREAVAQAREG
jgi:MFS transporter, FSR family, fosmidomycin resistance protein